jgi:hypothetical protein
MLIHFKVPHWDLYREDVPRVVVPLATGGDAVEREVLKATGELGNHILTNGASKNLAKIKAEYPTYFSSLELYAAVLDVLSYYHFRLPARRFVLGLFDVRFEGNVWEHLDSPETEEVAVAAATIEAQDKNALDLQSFDNPSRAATATEMLSDTPRSTVAPDFAKGFSLSPSSSAVSLSSEQPAHADTAKELQENEAEDPETHRNASGLFVNTKTTTGMAVPDGARADPSELRPAPVPLNQEEVVVSPTPSISQPPPIPPPRPPPNAYEILYTNKPYHKNFAKEAGLAPLPPRVKVLSMGPEEYDSDPMLMEARQSGFYATSASTVGRGSYSGGV